MKRIAFVVILSLTVAFSLSAQQIYKWKDEKGNWRFSDHPPGSDQGKKVETIKASPSSSRPAQATDPSAPPPDPLARGKELSSEFENMIDALALEFSRLGSSTAAVTRKKEIPTEMQNEIEKYRASVRALITKTKDEGAQRVLTTLMEDAVAKAGSSVSMTKSQSVGFFRAQCLKKAHDDYQKEWESHCRVRGCLTLPAELVQVLDARHREARADCFRSYPES